MLLRLAGSNAGASACSHSLCTLTTEGVYAQIAGSDKGQIDRTNVKSLASGPFSRSQLKLSPPKVGKGKSDSLFSATSWESIQAKKRQDRKLLV